MIPREITRSKGFFIMCKRDLNANEFIEHMTKPENKREVIQTLNIAMVAFRKERKR